MTLLVHFSVPGRTGYGILCDLVHGNSIVRIPGDTLTADCLDEIKRQVREDHRDEIERECCRDQGLNFFGTREAGYVCDLSGVQIILHSLIPLQG